MQHDEGANDVHVHLEIVWDDNNKVHATARATMAEITQAILDVDNYTKGPHRWQ